MSSNDSKSILDSLLFTASEKWNIDESQIMENMNKIAFHESKYGTDKYQSQQIGGGPGRGLFQYETGKGMGAHTAINRLINITDSYPKFLEGIVDKNYDISELTEEEQKMLFLADKLKDPTASLKGVDTPEELAEFWADEHWAGYGEDLDLKRNKMDKFIQDINYYGR